MSIVQDILRYNLPNNWVEVDYGSKTYHLFKLKTDGKEFTTVRGQFLSTKKNQNLGVAQILRVQHPYAYASFRLNVKYRELSHAVSFTLFLSFDIF